jgi:ferrous-iron efflux pump FieF
MGEKPAKSIEDTTIEPQHRARLMRLATYASVSVASVLVVTKFGAWIMTDSVSLLSTLIDSVLDVAASVLNLIAVHHALQPADYEHRFGHGKAEALAGLGQAAFISGSAAFLLIEAGQRILNPKTIDNSDIGIAVMVVAIALTVLLVVFQRYVVRKTGSIAIGADSLHYQTDVLVNAGVIVSLLLVSQLGWTLADPLIAIAIAGYIVLGVWKIAKGAINELMDRELPDEDRQRIRTIAMDHPEVRDLHDLRTRSSGTQIFIQLDLEMDGDLTLRDAHAVTVQVMIELSEAFPNAEIFVHQDPAGEENEHGLQV